MKSTTARWVADALTWSRIVSVVPITILAVYELEWWVFGVYVAAALTDWFDGWFARRGAPPRSEVDLDGIADLVFSFSTLIWFWLLIPGFISSYWLPYLPIFVLLEIYMTHVRMRHKRHGVPHLEFGRWAMALFLTLLPVLIVFGDVPWFVHTVLIIGVASKIQLAWAFWRRRATEP
ncbi:MAG: CDP-alcohol phosphatidyltransferase family protein [Woeseiaceae bacterium]|nr:CDP-alcohol phosphatidyltransferase family protein [Woeseiaceae bacterium]